MTQVSIPSRMIFALILSLGAERHGLSLEMLLRQAVELYLRSAEAYAKRKALN
jgi:hypothetical protein